MRHRSLALLASFTFAIAASTGAGLLAQARCASFSNSHTDSNGARIEVPYAPQLVPQSGLTVEAWITYDDTTLGNSTAYRWPTIVRTGINGTQNAFNFRIDASNNNTTELKFTVNANGRAHVRWPFASGRLMQWTHVAATYDGTMLRLIVEAARVLAETPAWQAAQGACLWAACSKRRWPRGAG